jgi:hypothetical protein
VSPFAFSTSTNTQSRYVWNPGGTAKVTRTCPVPFGAIVRSDTSIR